MESLETIAIEVKNEHLWWGHTTEHGWVVFDRADPKNEGESRYLVRCCDWVQIEVSRKEFSSDRFKWFRTYISALPDCEKQVAVLQLNQFRREYAEKRMCFRATVSGNITGGNMGTLGRVDV